MDHFTCSKLSQRVSFRSYIEQVYRLSGGNLALAAEQCQAEICGALWGFGNPDVAGIGMVIGYVMSNVLGFIIAFCLLTLREAYWRRKIAAAIGITKSLLSMKRKTPSDEIVDRIHGVMIKMLKKYYDSALVLAASIQVASTITLALLNFGQNSTGLGDTTARITWAVSLITMIPLLYIAFLPELLAKGSESNESITSYSQSTFASSSSSTRTPTWPLNDEDRIFRPVERSNTSETTRTVVPSETQYPREEFNFGLFVCCWILSLYPFVSRLISTFGKSEIGPGRHRVISHINWSILTQGCFRGVEAIGEPESRAIEVLGIFTSTLIFAMTVCKIVSMFIFWGQETVPRLFALRNAIVRSEGTPARSLRKGGKLLLFVLLPLLAAAQVWTIFRLQRMQRQMAVSTGREDPDDQWTFGQVVSVLVFVPVAIEAVWSARHAKSRSVVHREEKPALHGVRRAQTWRSMTSIAGEKPSYATSEARSDSIKPPLKIVTNK